MNERSKLIFKIAILAVGNFVLARMGLMFSVTAFGASPIWPAIGFVQAMILVYGQNCWPGIPLGIIPAMLTFGAPLGVALQIAVGDTLGTLLPAFLLVRFTRFEPMLKDSRSYFLFLGFMGFMSAAIGATFGASSFMIWGNLPLSGVWAAAIHWFVGDLLGTLIFGVLFIVWLKRPWIKKFQPAQVINAILLSVLTISASFIAYGMWSNYPEAVFPPAYFAFPLMVVSSILFGLRGTAIVSMVFSILAIYASLKGIGPFGLGKSQNSLTDLQLFLGIFGITGGTLSVFVEERNQLLQNRDDFIAIAAHELRTPITPLLMQVQLLMKSLKDLDAGKGQVVLQLLRKSESQIKELSNLIETLLNVSRARSGRLVGEKSIVVLTDVIKRVIEKYEMDLARGKCPLKIEVDPRIRGTWDGKRLELAIGNLVSNAVKYGLGKPIEISAKTSGRSVQISVMDQGIGVGEDDCDRIFDRFERAVPVESFGGMGLGLFLTRQIVIAHGGTIGVESRPGLGTKFTIDLPLGRASFETLDCGEKVV